MELLILLKLKWDIMVPTSKDFLLVLIKKLQQRKIIKNDDSEGIKTHANTFIDLILLGKYIWDFLRTRWMELRTWGVILEYLRNTWCIEWQNKLYVMVLMTRLTEVQVNDSQLFELEIIQSLNKIVV